MSSIWYRLGGCAWLLLFVGFLIYQLQHNSSSPTFLSSSQKTQANFLVNASAHADGMANNLPLLLKSDISRSNLSVHASTLAYVQLDTPTPKKQLMAAWFAGSREGAKDVQIFAAFLDLTKAPLPLGDEAVKNPWTSPKVILSRQSRAKKSKTHIKKLGNPVLYQSADGTIHLFVVATGYAGWAASKIYHLTSKTGEDFVFKQILPLSPFLNVSHLVRAVPVGLADGGFYLPVYHELRHKFELVLRFDKDGNVIQKIRPNPLKQTLQPSMAALSDDKCVMIRRHRHSTAMMVQTCHDGGFAWEIPMPSNVNNDNNSPNVVSLYQTPYVVHNQPKADATRHDLWLSMLVDKPDGFLLKKVALLDRASDEHHEVSYPTTLVLGDEVHIVYTHDRTSIRHLVFNQAWIDAQTSCTSATDGKAGQGDGRRVHEISWLIDHADCQGVRYAN